MNVVRQDNEWSCFAASLSMVTGIDYDIMDKSYAASPAVWPSIDGMSMFPDDSLVEVDEKLVSVYDWGEAVKEGYELGFHKYPVYGEKGILSITFVQNDKNSWSHAVAIDKSGYAVCPSGTFDDMHLTGFEDSCNILIGGYITVKEK